jgi:transcriptional regulator with XRE-family HTH domain
MSTFSERMRALMTERGASVRGVARAVPCDPALISKIRRGLEHPSRRVAQRIDAVLGAEGALYAQWQPARHLDQDERERFAQAAQRSSRVDAGYVKMIRQTSQTLVKLDTLHGGNDVFPLALRLFRDAGRKLGAGAYPPAIERDLMAATGEIGEVAAWLAYDADRQDDSRQIIMEAMLLSRQAGDRDMELFELAHLAMQSLHLRRPAEALRIATGVLDAGSVAPRVAALFDIRRGRALAQLGDERHAFDALDRAAVTLTESVSPRDPHWTWWINEVELMRHRATARAQLGQWAHAVPLREYVVGQGHPGYLDRVQLLEALIYVRDWKRAEQVIIDLVASAGAVGSRRTTNLLRRVAARIRATNGVPSTVADAAAALR